MPHARHKDETHVKTLDAPPAGLSDTPSPHLTQISRPPRESIIGIDEPNMRAAEVKAAPAICVCPLGAGTAARRLHRVQANERASERARVDAAAASAAARASDGLRLATILFSRVATRAPHHRARPPRDDDVRR